jgi:uncharacterized protein Veg
MKKQQYHRRHLRAPFFETVFFSDEDFVFKARSLNISEGGLLLNELPYFPTESQVPLLIFVPEIRLWEKAKIKQMQEGLNQKVTGKFLRVKAEFARKIEKSSLAEAVFETQIAVKFADISEEDQGHIQKYVDVFTENLKHLILWHDMSTTDAPAFKHKAYLLRRLLGYDEQKKNNEFEFEIKRDYQSLQWSKIVLE